jgi:hypothetical protein
MVVAPFLAIHTCRLSCEEGKETSWAAKLDKSPSDKFVTMTPARAPSTHTLHAHNVSESPRDKKRGRCSRHDSPAGPPAGEPIPSIRSDPGGPA